MYRYMHSGSSGWYVFAVDGLIERREDVFVCVSGWEAGRLGTGHQLQSLSPSPYIGYSHNESFSSVGGEFQPFPVFIWHLYMPSVI